MKQIKHRYICLLTYFKVQILHQKISSMKKLLFIALVLCSNIAYGQVEKSNPKKKVKEKKEIVARKNYFELGINLTTAIAAGGFRFTENFIVNDPYFLHLKVVTHGFGLRAGFGSAFYSQKRLDNIDKQGRVDAFYKTDLRLGLDYQIPIDEHWRLYYGVDVLSGLGSTQNDFLTDGVLSKINYKEKTIGGGPILGIQYHLNKRISLQTEATLYFTYTTSDKKVSYSNLPGLDPDFETKSVWKMPTGVPQSFFVIIRF